MNAILALPETGSHWPQSVTRRVFWKFCCFLYDILGYWKDKSSVTSLVNQRMLFYCYKIFIYVTLPSKAEFILHQIVQWNKLSVWEVVARLKSCIRQDQVYSVTVNGIYLVWSLKHGRILQLESWISMAESKGYHSVYMEVYLLVFRSALLVSVVVIWSVTLGKGHTNGDSPAVL